MNEAVAGPDQASGWANTYARVLQLYALQSFAIDSGDPEGWASTFTPFGEFHSPSYPEPACGRNQLVSFARNLAERQAKEGEKWRHVISNVSVRLVGRTLLTRAYLQIVSTSRTGATRIVRMTVIEDEMMGEGGEWLVSRRTVTPEHLPSDHRE